MIGGLKNKASRLHRFGAVGFKRLIFIWQLKRAVIRNRRAQLANLVYPITDC